MKKIVFALALVLVFTTLASAKDSVLCTVTAPENAMLEQYPTSSGPLSLGQMAELGLRPVRLTEATAVLNHMRNRAGCAGGTWSAETLPAGTLVLADADGNLRYKQDCGNRLVVMPEKAQTTAIPAPAPPSAIATPVVASGEDTGGDSGWWTMFGVPFMFFLGLALLIAFLVLLGWLLWHLLDWLGNNTPEARRRPVPLAPVTPVTSPTLVVPAPVVVAPLPRPIVGPVPVPVRTTRRYGPFAAVVITDRGAAGFQVVADGHDLGTFTSPVATEDAGPAGHYVVVTT